MPNFKHSLKNVLQKIEHILNTFMERDLSAFSMRKVNLLMRILERLTLTDPEQTQWKSTESVLLTKNKPKPFSTVLLKECNIVDWLLMELKHPLLRLYNQTVSTQFMVLLLVHKLCSTICRILLALAALTGTMSWLMILFTTLVIWQLPTSKNFNNF
jgi:hypothetical protein